MGDPQRLVIPKLGIDAGFEPLSVGERGKLDAPDGTSRVGWARDGPEPGENGTAVIAGHYDSRTAPAVFYRLGDLSIGDALTVRGEHGSVDFMVTRMESYAKARFPAEVYAPTSGASLRLITCGGEFDRSERHYRENLVVFASLPDQEY